MVALMFTNSKTMTTTVSDQITFDPSAKFRGYATRIRVAIHNSDRNDIQLMNDQLLWSSPFECDLKDMTEWLVAQKLLTFSERAKALSLMPVINNPSLQVA